MFNVIALVGFLQAQAAILGECWCLDTHDLTEGVSCNGWVDAPLFDHIITTLCLKKTRKLCNGIEQNFID